jgi:tRNA modification GTPase
MDLVQAEAVHDLIHSKTSRQSRLAVSALSGELGKKIHKTRAELVNLLTSVNAGIDFPEEVGDVPLDHAEETVRRSISMLEKLASTTRSGRFLRDGLRLAIVGKPNAGKSSLLNRLLNFERAIVTDIPGTTRDALEELLDINGIPVILTDTAGIRETRDRVEQIGIERSKKAVEEADLVLFISDLNSPWDGDDSRILEMIHQRPYVALGNKVDLMIGLAKESALDTSTVACLIKSINPSFIHATKEALAHIPISALTGKNLDVLSAWIESWALTGQDLQETGGSLNVRQGELCVKSVEALKLVLETIESGLPQDCLATDLKCSIDNLSEVCGEVVSEEIIANVFASFCIGK